MKKVIVAFDSFKGCISSQMANEAAKEGILSVYPDIEVAQILVADGGEGLLKLWLELEEGTLVKVKARDPLFRLVSAHYGLSRNGETALIEMAQISGLPLLKAQERNPWLSTSFGTGQLIKDALDKGCRNFIIGLGGSATNDSGLGMLSALGFQFLDQQQHPIDLGGRGLSQLYSIDTSHVVEGLSEAHFTVACDVKNPLYGPQGAAYIFAPQKGADHSMVEDLDQGLRHVAHIVQRDLHKDINAAGSGAAGGLGGAFLGFLNSTLVSGIELVLSLVHFEEKISGADLVITGEGKVDAQSIMGKVIEGMIKKAQLHDIPVIALTGSASDFSALNAAGLTSLFAIHPYPLDLSMAMDTERTKTHITQALGQIFRLLKRFEH